MADLLEEDDNENEKLNKWFCTSVLIKSILFSYETNQFTQTFTKFSSSKTLIGKSYLSKICVFRI